ncbi:hypothetical protein NQT69_05350 [Pseudoalteromonas shioyasakiensis]|uniref:hypothetical protein n=1 Tax=Pseudoalteromonas shioyasakiensis TaxID=1190813 RepID=UPI0021198E7C|nr:hypothetical protein [Pseudoalteromonas shioyasakiensis]MCQ8877458.1 hypothetical protein [Pseudoalteromonas shioyasakiensis]
MKNKKQSQLHPADDLTDEQKRQDYYRSCIAEFQQLGYQDQYLEQLGDELVPLLGVDTDLKET